jgi:HNH endonuclease/AP2 domain
MDKGTLHRLFEYREGNLYWRVANSNRIKVGDRAGYENNLGYTEVRIDNKLYLLHRLVYIYHYGELSDNIDHIDNNPRNNNIENLRKCSQSENTCNKRMQKNNTSGYKGVSYCKRTEKWKCNITFNGMDIWLGRFSSREKAVEEIKKARISIHKEFANHG